MTALRSLYVRFLRGTALGDVARATYHGLRHLRGPEPASTPHLPLHYRVKLFGHRTAYVGRYVAERGKRGFAWLINSRESSNFTYDLTPRNEAHLAEILSVVSGLPSTQLAGYIREINEDQQLKRIILERVAALGPHSGIDPIARFGRRVGWYALARALKPGVIVETGVEKGLGATVLCCALLRNAQEGRSGRYFGTDIDRGAGALWGEPYSSVGAILYGDSIESLMRLDGPIDLFINDSDHSADYEAREYGVIAPKLSPNAVVIGDNAHVTDVLLRFSREHGRRFLFFREEPADHWYPGAGIGFSFR
jgi:hypothetical protein